MATVLPTAEQRTLLDLATVKYMAAVSLAMPYLADRGFGEEIVSIAGLGVVTDDVQEFAHLRGRLWIPYMTDSGVINATTRCIAPHNCKMADNHKKYLRPPGMGDNLYGTRTYIEAVDTMCLVEGELDAITLHQIRIPAFATSGATKWHPHWTAIMDDFARVIVVTDGDTAGQKLAETVRNYIPWAINVSMPSGEDVNSMYLKEGSGYLKARIRA